MPSGASRAPTPNTIKIIEAAIDLGLPLQINSTVSRRTLPTTRRHGRTRLRVPAHALGCLLPRADGTWRKPRADHAQRSASGSSASWTISRGASHSGSRPPRRLTTGASRWDANGRAPRSGRPSAGGSSARHGGERRQRLRVRRPRRQHLSQRLPPHAARATRARASSSPRIATTRSSGSSAIPMPSGGAAADASCGRSAAAPARAPSPPRATPSPRIPSAPTSLPRETSPASRRHCEPL